ncbi:MAG: TonB-dependent receptor, partial [Sphingobacteriales bacterium]
MCKLKTTKVKQKFYKKLLSIAILVLAFTSICKAQTGKIAGKVSDKATGETLIGLTVGVQGSTKGASTDIEGRYSLALPAGTYNLTFKYLGYQTKTITGVTVAEGKVTSLDVIISETTSQSLKEVVVTGSFKKETVGALYAQQKNNISISSGISADLIRRSPDKNTSEVLKRVSGASIQDNKFIIVRGLSDRYNSAMLNNAMLPNTEVDKKAFSFDILPSNLIDAIVVNKTASADMPGDFSGGIVQVTTKDFPDSKFLNLSLGTSVNTQSAFRDFQTAQKNGNEMFGLYDKGRDIPASFPTKNEYLALRATSSPQAYELSRAFKNNWGYDNVISKLGPIFQMNYGNSKIFKNDSKFGTILSLSYRYDERLKQTDQIAYAGQNVGDKFSDNAYNYNANIGGLANFTYSWGNNKISLKNLYNRVLESQFTNRQGIDESSQEFLRTADYLLQRSLISNQLRGEHLLSQTSKVKIDWNLNYSNTDRKEPGFKRMEYAQGVASVLTGSTDPRLAGNFSSILNENSYGAIFNTVIPVKWFKDNNKIKFGYFSQFRARDFNARVIGFIRDVGFNAFNELALPQDKIFDSANIRPGGFVLDEITNGSDAYKAKSALNAGYLMFDGFVSNKLRVGAGARLESYNQKLNSADNSFNSIVVDTTNINILPSVNLIYNLTEKSSIRLSGSKTVGRPEFREIAPFAFFDFNKNVSIQGNPKLKQSSTINADLGFATYPNSGETFAISAFYKTFDLPIEQVLQIGTTGRTIGYNNAKSATLFGIEAEIRKSLKFISDGLKNLS